MGLESIDLRTRPQFDALTPDNLSYEKAQRLELSGQGMHSEPHHVDYDAKPETT